jgi:hypothetical protein
MLNEFRRSFLSVPVFVRRAYAALEGLDENEYRSRSSDGVKELVEEVMPLAALLKHLEVPGRRLRCRLVSGERDHDAQVRMSGPEVDRGFWESHYFVEVTSAVFPQDYLRREALARYGTVFLGPNIRRVGSKKKGSDRIVSQAEAEDGDAPLRSAITWVMERLTAKSAKTYPRPCLLVVNVDPDRPLSFGEWAELSRSVCGHVDRERFKMSFVVDWHTNTVFPL